MDTNIIMLKKISKKYRSKAGEFNALSDVSLEIDKGDFVTIVGKSGSGKSTLLNIMSGIDNPSCGEITVNNTPICKLNENKKAVWRGKNLGIVFQFFQLLPTLTILENIILPMDFSNYLPFNERKIRAYELLKKVGISEHANKLPDALSGGEQQRSAIARAMANNPDIIIADEPTGNLDSQTAGEILDLFHELNAEGKTVVMVTHDKEIFRNATKTVILSDGKIEKISVNTPKEAVNV